MPTINVGPDSTLELQEIADVLGKSKKVIVVTGAGISTNCGIPDFRSENGLYSMIQAQYDAALRNPPWESRDEYDIDDRPKKKRRRWYYEVVRQEDGEVVQVIDEECEKKEGKQEDNPEVSLEVKASEELEESPQTSSPRLRSTSPQQQQTNNTLCSSPLSSPPGTPTDTADIATQSTLASSVTSTRSQSPVETPQASQTSRAELPNLKGKDLFDSMVWKDPFTTSIFYMFITKFRQTIQQEVTTLSPTHQFIRTLRDAGKLVRNYTQNIDCLEERMDLCTDLERGPGNRARFSSRVQREHRPTDIKRDSAHDGGVECVQLHGSLVALRCQVCGKGCSWDASREATTLSGYAPDCPSCQEYSNQRAGKGRRGIAVGRLRPDIVLYGEEHPSAGLVGPIITHDLGLNPDVLLILGTSLRVHGLKVMVREFAKAVHSRGGKVVFVNKTKPPESTWGDVIDYWVGWDCDAWVKDLKARRGEIWLPQGKLHEENRLRRESAMEARSKKESALDIKPERKKGPRPQCVRDDKMNGVYVTFKILDLLGALTDSDGNMSIRPVYWPNNARKSTGTANQDAADSVAAISVSKLKQELLKPAIPTSKKRKSLPVPQTSTHLANTSQPRKPRKSCPPIRSIEKDDTSYIAATWEKIRKVAPSLSEKPPASGRIALEELSANMSPLMKTYVNIYPTEYRKTYFGARVPLPNLITHPPSGLTIPMHTPKRSPPKHAYSTRAKRQSCNAEETIIVTPHPTSADSSPRTPGQIKDLGSISAILSSSPDCSQGSSNDVFFDAQETIVTA